jgi:anaphase-promoting complex subunit 6
MHFLQLAAQCLVAMKSWDECLTLLDSVERDHESWIDSQEKYIMKHEGRGIEKGSAEAELPRGLHAKGQRADGSFEVRTHRGINKFENSDENTDNASVSTVALLYFLRGKVYGALENRSLAKYWYKLALSSDPFCFEAFHALTSDHMLSPEEERSLLASLNIKAEDIWLHIHALQMRLFTERSQRKLIMWILTVGTKQVDFYLMNSRQHRRPHFLKRTLLFC